jgi:hypothetical protein
VFYGSSVASAGIAFLISIPQLIGATAGAPGALQTDAVLQNIGINLGAVALFAWLFSKDWQVRHQQQQSGQHMAAGVGSLDVRHAHACVSLQHGLWLRKHISLYAVHQLYACLLCVIAGACRCVVASRGPA